MKKYITKVKNISQNIEGRVGPPLLLYFLGVPGGICLLLWVFIWRGK
jgi:hypothetical protein